MCAWLMTGNNDPVSRLSTEKEKKNNTFTKQTRMYMFISRWKYSLNSSVFYKK